MFPGMPYLGCSIVEIRIEFVNYEAVLFEGVQADAIGFGTCLVQEVQKPNNIKG